MDIIFAIIILIIVGWVLTLGVNKVYIRPEPTTRPPLPRLNNKEE